MQLKETFEKVKRASKSLALISDQQRNDVLNAVADAIKHIVPGVLLEKALLNGRLVL